jgi:hypothetical protein
MNGLLRVGALCALVGLSGCYLPEVRPEKIAMVQPNVTTSDQIIELFGMPSSELNLAGGTKVFLYYRGQFERTFEQNVPFYNLVYVDYDASTYDYFTFNRDGVLQTFSIPHFAADAKVPNPGNDAKPAPAPKPAG